MTEGKNTKEKILSTALSLFAKKGYEAVSVSEIAEEIGITKGALYRHYQNKRDIFISILKRMEEYDRKDAENSSMPEKPISEGRDAYENTKKESIRAFSKAIFRRWTMDEFSSDFRKMLTLEQFGSEEAAELFENYLSKGPFSYMTDIFKSLIPDSQNAENTALAFYGPLFLMYSLWDLSSDKEEVIKKAECYIDSFLDNIKEK